MSEPATQTPASPGGTQPEESPWQDDPGYPHRIENHVKVYLHLEETSAGLRWVVSPVTVDGYPLDGVEDGHYCDYEGHPPGARPDWDRQHRMAKDLYLPTAAELLPILVAALGTSVDGPTVDQLRAASDLLAEHAEWRSERADLSAGESVGDFPDASGWHDSDDAGCDLADRANRPMNTSSRLPGPAPRKRPSPACRKISDIAEEAPPDAHGPPQGVTFTRATPVTADRTRPREVWATARKLLLVRWGSGLAECVGPPGVGDLVDPLLVGLPQDDPALCATRPTGVVGDDQS